ncbi:unnamed protein product, partial [Lepidochelys olivacea]
MSCSKALCCLPQDYYADICPCPCIDVCNEPCVTSCGDSTAVVFVPPVIVRFQRPTFATCPQDSIVGTTIPNLPARPSSFSGSSGGFSGSFGYGGRLWWWFKGWTQGWLGGSYCYGGPCGYGRRSQRSISISRGGYSGY